VAVYLAACLLSFSWAERLRSGKFRFNTFPAPSQDGFLIENSPSLTKKHGLGVVCLVFSPDRAFCFVEADRGLAEDELAHR
jgi:hypothetical protein